MHFVFFVHSLISDWNHGNAHFIRGIVTELQHRGHKVTVYEPAMSWSLFNLIKEYGSHALDSFYHYYPDIRSIQFKMEELDLNEVLDGAHVVIVHEWNDHELVHRLGMHRKQNNGYRLFFHDTHHRAVSDPESMKNYDLRYYDGVLAFGEVLKNIYLERSWALKAWTWHEAADIRIFRPLSRFEYEGDIVWIGNWGDEERSIEFIKYLFDPVESLKLHGRVYGVRYPVHAQQMLRNCGLEYAGWTPNYLVPQIFSRYKLTVHIPRRQYVEMLPGIPTIRPFEALASGIPLICSPWDDCEKLFEGEKDYLMAKDCQQMKEHINLIINDLKFSSQMVLHGLKTVLDRHTCANRVDQLLKICEESGIKNSTADLLNEELSNHRGNR
ncbi:MAG TPA: glycosyltransferase [Chitinispirillaceae bacterium]|nr:glycosyltransferase [Chitinispirillaceae bacterium]